MEETQELLLKGLEELSTEVETRMAEFATRLSELEKVCSNLANELQQIRNA